MVTSISKPQDIGWDFYTTRVDDRGSVSAADVCLTPLRWAVAGKAYNVAVVKGTVSLPTGKVSINRLHKENRFELSHRILGVALTLLFSPLVTLGLGIKLLLRDRASVERYQWVKIAEGERWAVMQQQMLIKKPKEIALTSSQKAKMERLSEGLEEKYPKKVLLFADRFYTMAKSIERKLGNALPQDDQFQTKRDRLIAWMVTTLGEREGDLTALPKIYVRLSKLAPQRQKESLDELLTDVDKGHDLSHFLDKLPTVPNEERICEEMGALETLQQKPENLALLKFIDRYPATDLPKRKEYRARLITWLFAEIPYKERYTYVGGLVADQAVAQLTRDLRHVLVLLEEQGDKASADQTEAFLTELADKSLVCAPTWLELAARHIRVLTNTDKMEDRLQQYLLEIKEDLIQGYLDETTKKLQAQRYQLHTDWNWLNVMRSKLGDELGLAKNSTRLDSTTRVMFYPPGLDPHSVRAHFWETFTIDTILERLKNKFEYDQAGALFDQDLAAQLKQIELKRQGLGQLEEFLNEYTELTFNLDTDNLEEIQKVLTFLEEHKASYGGIMDAAQVLHELSKIIKQGDLEKAKGKCQEIEELIDQASSKFEGRVGVAAIQKRYFEKKGESELPNALAMRTLLEEHRYFSRLSA